MPWALITTVSCARKSCCSEPMVALNGFAVLKRLQIILPPCILNLKNGVHNAILAAAIVGKTVIADTSMTVFFVSVLASMGELWIGFHAAFANVSALILVVWADTQAKESSQQPPDD